MNGAIAVMSRHELKYILSQDQFEYLIDAISDHMHIDNYGKTTIASLYYDTKDYRLIRTSLERGEFKEKIRLRSYGIPSSDKPVYLELKRKANGIVYKRRIETSINDAVDFFNLKNDNIGSGQIAKEITYFRNYYGEMRPSCLIIYERMAYLEDNGSLRLTIDYNPRYRASNLRLDSPMDGIPLLDKGIAILEIKIQDVMPLWLSHILDKGKIYKCTFSKYGKAYEKMCLENKIGG